MSAEFYAGHSFKWISKFLEAVPKNEGYRRNIAFCLACCIHHQYVYKRQATFKLTHKKLGLFCIDRRNLKRYLEIFEKAKLIEYKIEGKKSPIVTLLLIPHFNNKQQKINKIYHPDVQNRTCGMCENVHDHVRKRTCLENSSKKETKKVKKDTKKDTEIDTKEDTKKSSDKSSLKLRDDKYNKISNEVDKLLEEVGS